jgi:hypothetical protein
MQKCDAIRPAESAIFKGASWTKCKIQAVEERDVLGTGEIEGRTTQIHLASILEIWRGVPK